jgi:DNA-binding winged helix-turn-helix (wHTH) protein
MNVPTDEIDKFEKKGYKIIEEVELDERNYAKEYANYQGTPEQIARRSSRNKARRAMGDKAVKGMDVGHADNDPMNNCP